MFSRVPSRPSRPEPTQARSRERREAIVRAASKIFRTEGFDEATMDGIAAAAGTSIGSVYRFFATKKEILAALAERYFAASNQLFDRLLVPEARKRPWQETVGAIVDGFAALNAEELLVPVRANWQLVQSLPSRRRRLHPEFASRAAPFMAAQFPGIPARERVLVGTMVAEIIGAMLSLVAHEPPRVAATVIARTKTVITRFLAPYARRQPG